MLNHFNMNSFLRALRLLIENPLLLILVVAFAGIIYFTFHKTNQRK